jgi:hypothetical protein
VYGDPLEHPQRESYWGTSDCIVADAAAGNVNCYGPRSCYDEGKRAGEALCFEWLRKGVDTRFDVLPWLTLLSSRWLVSVELPRMIDFDSLHDMFLIKYLLTQVLVLPPSAPPSHVKMFH